MPSRLPRWLAEVDDALACRAPGVLLVFNTGDRVLLGDEDLPVAFLRYALAHRFSARGYHVGYFAAASGFERLTPPRARATLVGPDPYRDIPGGPTDPSLVLVAAGRALRSREARSLLILDYADYLLPISQSGAGSVAPGERMLAQLVHAWGQDDAVRQTENFVILIAYEDAVSTILTQGGAYRRISIELPSTDERLEFAELLLSMRARGFDHQIGVLDEGFAVSDFARSTSGLRLADVETLFRRAGARRKPVSRDEVRLIKQNAIRQLSRDLIEIIEPTGGFETVAGAQHAKDYFDMIRAPWAKGSASVPGAVLLAGVPGCGKSHIVRAIAHELEVPLLAMRSVRDSLVGQSERNLELVLRIAEGLSPCILFTDEIDQAVGQRSTSGSHDAGTSERMLARVFEFFGSMRHRGRILWIGASNRPDVLDAALLDRFQVCIPFVHPTCAERHALFPLLAAEAGRTFASDVALAEVASLEVLQELTARSLQEIVVSAGLRADSAAGAVGVPIGRRHLLATLEDYKPNYNPQEHEFLALKALSMTTFQSLLPWMSVAGMRPQAEVPRYALPFVGEAGRIDSERLSGRLNALELSRIESRMRQ